MNPEFNPTIAIAIRDSAKKLSDPRAQMLLYRHAFDYSPASMNQELFELWPPMFLKVKSGKEQVVKQEFDRIKKKAYRNAIYNLAYSPDFKVYPRGKHPINLKAGQTTENGLHFPAGLALG